MQAALDSRDRDPHRVSTGIERVVVNGRVAYYNGEHTGPRSGRFLPNPHNR